MGGGAEGRPAAWLAGTCNVQQNPLSVSPQIASIIMPDFANLSLDLQRAGIQPGDLWDVTRVYRTAGSPDLLINAKHGPSGTEVSGIAASEAVIMSFGLWFAVVTGALPLLDRTTLKMAKPDYLWMTWAELVEDISYKIDDAPVSELLMVSLAIIEHHQWPKGGDELRKVVNGDPHSIVRVLNLDESVTWRSVGKANMAWLWLWQAAYRMHAGRSNLLCPWEGAPNAEGFPAEMGVSGDKLTHAVKAALPLARPARPLRGSAAGARLSVLDVDLEAGPGQVGAAQPAGLPPAPVAPPSRVGALSPEFEAAFNRIVARGVPGAELDVARPAAPVAAQLVEAMDRLSEVCVDFPAESLARARDNLHSRLAPIQTAAPVLLPLLKATTGHAVASVVQAAARTLAADAGPSVKALQEWFAWLEDTGLLVATRAVREKALRDVAAAMGEPHRQWNWRQEAANIAVDRQSACAPHVMTALLAVNDRASFWRAFGEFVMTATCPDQIKLAVEGLTGSAEGQGTRPAWAAHLLGSVPGPGRSQQSKKRQRESQQYFSEDFEEGDSEPRQRESGPPPSQRKRQALQRPSGSAGYGGQAQRSGGGFQRAQGGQAQQPPSAPASLNAPGRGSQSGKGKGGWGLIGQAPRPPSGAAAREAVARYVPGSRWGKF